MTCHALVVDDNQEVLEDVGDRLESLGHTCDSATTQADARELLKNGTFSYALLDLEIPVRSGRPCRVLNGKNLLREIRSTRGFEDVPIIVMTADGHDSPRLAVDLMKNGASDVVSKPLHDGDQALERAIADALRSVRRNRSESKRYRKIVKGSRSPRPFRRGRLVFYPSRVELGGVKVCGDDGSGMIRRILDILQCPDARCRRRAYSGEELAELVGTNGGPTAIAGAIRNFRNRVKRTMLLEANVAINAARDVIVNDRQHGYRFSDKIILAERPNLLAADREEVAKENRPSGSPLSLGAANKDSRAKWILTELRKTGRLRKSQIIQRTGWSDSTTRRVLAKLREAGQIVFEGSARSGYWRTV